MAVRRVAEVAELSYAVGFNSDVLALREFRLDCGVCGMKIRKEEKEEKGGGVIG